MKVYVEIVVIKGIYMILKGKNLRKKRNFSNLMATFKGYLKFLHDAIHHDTNQGPMAWGHRC